MVRLITEVAAIDHLHSMPLAIAVFISVSAVVALCAKARHVRRRAPPQQQINNNTNCKASTYCSNNSNSNSSSTMAPKSPFVVDNNGGRECEADDEVEDGFREGGVWQRSILMGDKCQPPEFSGVIYYDSCGNQLSELPPRSPARVASPLSSFFLLSHE